MIKLTLISLFIFSFASSANDLKLIGSSTLEYSIFKIDVYDISYYKSESGDEEMILIYKRDIKRKHSIEGWKVGLAPLLKKDPTLKSQLDWITQQTIDLKEGDKFTINKTKHLVTLYKNGTKVSHTEDEVLSKIIFYPWIGEEPIDQSLRSKLLKNLQTP